MYIMTNMTLVITEAFLLKQKQQSYSLLIMKRQKMRNHGDKWRNEEGLKGLQPSFAKSLRNLTLKFKGLCTQKNSRLSRLPPPPQQNLIARLMTT